MESDEPSAIGALPLPFPLKGRRVSTHETADIAVIYEAYASSIYRYLITLLGNPDEAEDALQEIFLGVMRRPRRERLRDLRAYLFRAAHNQAIVTLRRCKRHEEMPTNVCWIALEACKSDDCELAIDVDRALRALPTEQREVIALKLGEELTFREIAQVLDIPKNTAASRYRLALARLRAVLESGES